MLRALCFLLSLQCSLVYLLGLNYLALMSIEKTSVVDDVECRCILRALCFLVSLQCPLIYLLDLSHLALISIEKAQIIKSIINVLILACTRTFDDEELLYTSICIREQALLYQSIL